MGRDFKIYLKNIGDCAQSLDGSIRLSILLFSGRAKHFLPCFKGMESDLPLPVIILSNEYPISAPHLVGPLVHHTQYHIK